MQKVRIHYLNRKELRKGSYVLYWMSQAPRAESNTALDFAVHKANELKLPLIACFCIHPEYPGACRIHYRFLLDSLDECFKGLRDKGIKAVITSGFPPEEINKLGTDAALLICDYGYLRHHKQWMENCAEQSDCLVIGFEGNVLVPVEAASEKEQWSAYTLRRRIHPLLDLFTDYSTEEIPRISSCGMDLPAGYSESPDGLKNRKFGLQPLRMQDQKIRIPPGRKAALERFDRFINEKLGNYARDKNNPTLNATSEMSAALHFGLVSAPELALAIAKHLKLSSLAACAHEGAASFLEELIIRRELALNYVHYNSQYDSILGIPDWAAKTLSAAAVDSKTQLYSREDLEFAKTDDPYWNAAQNQLVYTAHMHGYMRMYWCKRLIAWTHSPEEAWNMAMYLNDSYSLDGRDPNGYAGIAWCFGKHDRPWTGRPIYGTVRYMNDKGLRRKFDADAYAAMIAALKED